MLLLLFACANQKPCQDTKEQARVAWGEVAGRYQIALQDARNDLAERQGRLAALAAHPDAPQAGKDALTSEVTALEAQIRELEAQVADAEAARTAFGLSSASAGKSASDAAAAKLSGKDVDKAVGQSASAASVCGDR